jgi:hypothetical protein
MTVATSAVDPAPTASSAEDGGLEPHPKGYFGLPTVKRSRHLAASSSARIRLGEANFSPLLTRRIISYSRSTIVRRSGGSSPARKRPASAGLRDSRVGSEKSSCRRRLGMRWALPAGRMIVAASPVDPTPTASSAEDGGLEPHPESYSGLAIINRSRHLAASSSASLRAGRGKFAPSCHVKYALWTVINRSGGSSPARKRPASAGLRDSGGWRRG